MNIFHYNSFYYYKSFNKLSKIKVQKNKDTAFAPKFSIELFDTTVNSRKSTQSQLRILNNNNIVNLLYVLS